MKLYLNDTNSDEPVTVELNVTGIVNTPDLFAGFINRDQVYGLKNDDESPLFDELNVRKVNHIIYGKTTYGGFEFFLKVGVYISGGSLCYFLIDQESDLDEFPFDSFSLDENNIYTEMMLFDYKEYKQLTKLGLEPLSFEVFVKKLLNDKLERNQNTLYNIHKGNSQAENYQSYVGFEKFLIEEEQKIK